MSDYDYCDEPRLPCSIPPWLEAIAIRVDELVSEEANRKHFAEMLRQWSDEHGKRPSKEGVQVLPRRAMTLPEKYAALAAIHDQICEEAKSLDLWGIRRKSKNLSRTKIGVRYAALAKRVENISDQDQERLEQVLADVEADRAAKLSEKGPEGRRGDSDAGLHQTGVASDPGAQPSRPLTGAAEEVTDEAMRAAGAEKDAERPLAITTGKAKEILADNGIPGIEDEKDARQWCKERKIRKYTRQEWKTEFKKDPPRIPGNVRYYSAADVLKAAMEEGKRMEEAEEAIAEREKAKRRVQGENQRRTRDPQ